MKGVKQEGACLVWVLKASPKPVLSRCLEICSRAKLFHSERAACSSSCAHSHCSQSLSYSETVVQCELEPEVLCHVWLHGYSLQHSNLRGVLCINLFIYSSMGREKQLGDPPVYLDITKVGEAAESPERSLADSPNSICSSGQTTSSGGLVSGLWTSSLQS